MPPSNIFTPFVHTTPYREGLPGQIGICPGGKKFETVCVVCMLCTLSETSRQVSWATCACQVASRPDLAAAWASTEAVAASALDLEAL